VGGLSGGRAVRGSKASWACCSFMALFSSFFFPRPSFGSSLGGAVLIPGPAHGNPPSGPGNAPCHFPTNVPRAMPLLKQNGTGIVLFWPSFELLVCSSRAVLCASVLSALDQHTVTVLGLGLTILLPCIGGGILLMKWNGSEACTYLTLFLLLLFCSFPPVLSVPPALDQRMVTIPGLGTRLTIFAPTDVAFKKYLTQYPVVMKIVLLVLFSFIVILPSFLPSWCFSSPRPAHGDYFGAGDTA